MMKRMTIRNSDGSVSQPTDLNWAAALEKLAAYEDCGLTPQEIKELLHDSAGPLHKKLGTWIDAERDGRMLILPCKVGNMVYIIGSKYRAGRYETWVNTGKFRYSDLEKIGKTVFLTREEAEVAIRKWVAGSA